MSKAAIFTLKLESDLRDEFMSAAAASHRPASQVVRELMRTFVETERQRGEATRFLQGKVDTARVSVRDGHGRDNASVEADFAALRAAADSQP
jgi:predicted transcriptional regulator